MFSHFVIVILSILALARVRAQIVTTTAITTPTEARACPTPTTYVRPPCGRPDLCAEVPCFREMFVSFPSSPSASSLFTLLPPISSPYSRLFTSTLTRSARSVAHKFATYDGSQARKLALANHRQHNNHLPQSRMFGSYKVDYVGWGAVHDGY